MNGEIELPKVTLVAFAKAKEGVALIENLVFGLLKHNAKVHAFPIPNARTEMLLPTIKPDSIV